MIDICIYNCIASCSRCRGLRVFPVEVAVYEEKEDYVTALSYLEKHKSRIQDLPYLELREKRLKEKILNKPLSRGRRK